MTNKFLIRRARVSFASIVILLASIGSFWAQDTVAAPESGVEIPGRIEVPLSGQGVVARVGNLTLSPNKVDTGLVDVGLSTNKTFTLSHEGNSGDAPIEMQEAALFGKSANEFSVDFNGYQTLSVGQSIPVSVTFTPLTPGDKAAGLRINVEGATSPYVVLFTGVARYPLTSSLEQSTNRLSFGQVLQNSNAQKNFTLSNGGETGGPAINVSAMQLSGVNADSFSINFTPMTLNPGESKNVSITLLTDTVGSPSAKVEIFHDGINGALELELDATVKKPNAVAVNFSMSNLNANKEIKRGTTLQFGPDGKLYVGQMDGTIYVFNVQRNGKNNYQATLAETINLIYNVQNHNDDGSLNNQVKGRTLTGIYVEGSAAAPVIYAASSDPRQAAGPKGTDSNLDTNSGILHKLTKNGNKWSKQDLVRGLPRSEENHAPNGLVKQDNKIYLNIGGHTNMGAPSNNFAELPEYALSAAVLVIDLAAIGNNTYDLPTLNGRNDQNDPFGGDDGLNQAILESNGPVKIFAAGFRNAYDIVLTESNRFYVWDNGPNTGWGGTPGGNCSNAIKNDGSKYKDALHLISQGYYGGHSNPTRGNKSNKFGGQSPIEGAANTEECNYKVPGPGNGALITNHQSTNGIDEYTASNFEGSMKGNLIAALFNKQIQRVEFNDNGTAVTSVSTLQENIGNTPLDLTTQADGDVFPGTIWVIDNIDPNIRVLEPSDY